MGRLEHLRQTLPPALQHKDSEVVLVDYSCPEHSAEWAESEFRSFVRNGKLKLIKVPGKTVYHGCHAKNVAHRHGRGDILINIDADNVVDDAFLDNCRRIFQDKTVAFVHPRRWDPQTASSGIMGRIAVRRHSWLAVGGYDEDMHGWGGDDHDFLRRLYAAKLIGRTLPHEMFKAIDHDDDLRTKLCGNYSKTESAAANTSLSLSNLKLGKIVANVGRKQGET